MVSLPGPLQVPVFLVPRGRPVPRCRFWGLSHTREPPAIPCASVGSGSRRPPRRSRAHSSVTASDPVRELGPWRGRRARKRGRGGPSAQTGLSFCDDVRPRPMRPPTQHGDRSLDPDHYLVWGLAGVGLGRGLGGAGSKGHECREQSLKSSRRRKPAPGTRWRAVPSACTGAEGRRWPPAMAAAGVSSSVGEGVGVHT